MSNAGGYLWVGQFESVRGVRSRGLANEKEVGRGY